MINMICPEIRRQLFSVTRHRVRCNKQAITPHHLQNWITRLKKFNYTGCNFVILCPSSDWFMDPTVDDSPPNLPSQVAEIYQQVWHTATKCAKDAAVIALELPPTVYKIIPKTKGLILINNFIISLFIIFKIMNYYQNTIVDTLKCWYPI